ncbi:hypothetical protein [Gloeobacter morelensis]|uniref:hypothetical protein n=1 Tax=Gloeobacter morelensis TaxID=2907343 RepID=UPI001E4A293F|nr:hypothetical protein [Gloeobacter morelensis]UFP97295.1 hypothetical protein ISF26_24565 [Gloeobacter morelensis MG652769]
MKTFLSELTELLKAIPQLLASVGSIAVAAVTALAAYRARSNASASQKQTHKLDVAAVEHAPLDDKSTLPLKILFGGLTFLFVAVLVALGTAAFTPPGVNIFFFLFNAFAFVFSVIVYALFLSGVDNLMANEAQVHLRNDCRTILEESWRILQSLGIKRLITYQQTDAGSLLVAREGVGWFSSLKTVTLRVTPVQNEPGLFRLHIESTSSRSPEKIKLSAGLHSQIVSDFLQRLMPLQPPAPSQISPTVVANPTELLPPPPSVPVETNNGSRQDTSG